jgi:hypothetical protein
MPIAVATALGERYPSLGPSHSLAPSGRPRERIRGIGNGATVCQWSVFDSNTSLDHDSILACFCRCMDSFSSSSLSMPSCYCNHADSDLYVLLEHWSRS